MSQSLKIQVVLFDKKAVKIDRLGLVCFKPVRFERINY